MGIYVKSSIYWHKCHKISFMRKFAERLKELREEKGLSALALSKAVLINNRNIGRWEKSQFDITSDNLIKLADFFDVTTDYLLGRTDDY